MNITEPIRRHAMLKPASVAVIRADDTSVSYRALDGMIDAIAGHLSTMAAEPGLVAGLTMAGPDEFAGLVVALALARLGVATADMALPAVRMDLCCPDRGRAGPDGVPSLPVAALWGAVPTDPETVPPGPINRAGAALCRIFATSGTTGQPRFVPISHDLMTARVLGKLIAQGERDDIHLCAAGFGGAMGYHDILRSLFAGGTLVITNPAVVEAAIRRLRVNSMLMSPVTLGQIVQALPDTGGPLPSLVEVEISGGKLPDTLRALAERRLCNAIVEVYGASETHVIASAPARLLADRPGAVGIVHPGVLVDATDPDGVVLPAGETGLLRVGGPSVAPGYYRDEAATATAFQGGCFLTGDTGSVSADGVITLHGRVNEVINAGGVKVNPALIEDVLLAQPNVSDAAAFGLPDALGIIQIWAGVVTGPAIDMAALSAACRARLGAQAPRFLLPLTQVPRNANGKIMRDVLVRLAQQKLASEAV